MAKNDNLAQSFFLYFFANFFVCLEFFNISTKIHATLPISLKIIFFYL